MTDTTQQIEELNARLKAVEHRLSLLEQRPTRARRKAPLASFDIDLDAPAGPATPSQAATESTPAQPAHTSSQDIEL